MSITTKEAQTLNDRNAQITKAMQAGAAEKARQLIKEQTSDARAFSQRSMDLPETEVIEKFADVFQGRHTQDEYVDFQKSCDQFLLIGTALGLINPVENQGKLIGMEVRPEAFFLKSHQAIKRRHPRLYEEARRASAQSFQVAKRLGKIDELEKAMYSTGAGVGDEWVPTITSPTLEDQVRVEAIVVPLFREIQMPSNPYTLPVKGNLPNFVTLAEATTNSPTTLTQGNATTASRTLTASKFVLAIPFSEEMDEDSIIPFIPFLREELAEAKAHDHDYSIINGDTTNPHQDSNVDTPNHRGRAYIGLRKAALALSTTVDGTTYTTTDLTNLIGLMDRFAGDPRKLAWIMSPKSYARTRGLAEVLTVDKFGAGAAILNGQVGSLFQIPIVVSAELQSNQDATGVYDGTTTNRSSVVLVNHRAWVVGTRRPLTLKLVREDKYDQHQMVASFRADFQALENRATAGNTHVGLVYGIQNSA